MSAIIFVVNYKYDKQDHTNQKTNSDFRHSKRVIHLIPREGERRWLMLPSEESKSNQNTEQKRIDIPRDVTDGVVADMDPSTMPQRTVTHRDDAEHRGPEEHGDEASDDGPKIFVNFHVIPLF